MWDWSFTYLNRWEGPPVHSGWENVLWGGIDRAHRSSEHRQVPLTSSYQWKLLGLCFTFKWGLLCLAGRKSFVWNVYQKLTSLGNSLQNERIENYSMSGWGQCTAKIFRLWLTVLTPLAAVKSCPVLRAVLVYIINSVPIKLWIVANKERN